MVENIIISKSGSEASDGQRKTFSSTQEFEQSGSNLVVYVNNNLKTRDEYTVLDSSTIRFSSALKKSDTVKFLITKLTDLTENTEFEDRIYQLDRISKKLDNKVQSTIEKRPDEEQFTTAQVVIPEQIWADDIPENPEQAQQSGVAVYKQLITLSEDVTVADKRGWVVYEDETLQDRMRYWIGPRFGHQYNIRLFDYQGNEIPSSDPIQWYFDYEAGYLTIQNPDHGYLTPFRISGYIYRGRRALDQLAHWKDPVFSRDMLPMYHNDDGDIRLVSIENEFYRFDAVANMWRQMNYGSDTLRDPVPSASSLPQINNQRGDIRLVLEDNDLYSWDDLSEQWLLLTGYSFSPENYYKREELDDFLSNKADSAHNHDSIYYRKTEIDNLVRWRPSRASFDDLPPYTENQDGDVILTRDTSTIYRWVVADPNTGQGQWTALIESNFNWKGPVQTFSNLPMGGNIVGDIRLVLDEEKTYYWEGTEWTEVKSTIADHTHDQRYIQIPDLYWKAPIDSESNLPLTGNTAGDVRLVLDTNLIYRWNAPATKWEVLTQQTSWKNPVNTLAELPVDAEENDIVFVAETARIYYWTGSVWEDIGLKDHDHNDLYYTQSQVDARFDINSGHTHDGVNSAQIDYNDLLNIPYFYWKAPVFNESDLPSSGNTAGDAKIVVNDQALYVWNGTDWKFITSGLFVADHDHDSRYYTQSEVDTLIQSQVSNFASQIANKANENHLHDDRYYTKDYIDDKFDVQDGHNHNGINSQKIDFYDLDNIPDFSLNHDHDSRYYTQDQLRTPGSSSVHFENIIDMPAFTSNWKNPVETFADLPATNNSDGDLRIVLDSRQIYSWDGSTNTWDYVGIWDVSTTSHWKDPVDLESNLPQSDNLEGDVRLVLAKNTFYRWNAVEQQWKPITAQASGGSGGVSLENSLVMVFLNGINLQQGEEWEIQDENSIQLTVATEEEDSVAVVVYDQFNDFYRRFDFTSFSLQTEFTIGSEPVYRQEIVLEEGQTIVQLSSPYEVGSRDLMIWWNGLLQERDADYFETSSTTIELADPAVEGAVIIALIFDTGGTNAVYTKEQHTASDSQQVFELEYPYKVGKNHLLVFQNGQLQKVGNDYNEIDNQTVEIVDPCYDGEKLTFMTFNATVSSGESDIQSACSIPIGTPSDGYWTDGLFTWNENTLTCDALDDVNEALMSLADTRPSSLSGAELISSEPQYTGFISDGNTHIEDIVGIEKDYLTPTGDFYLYTPDNSMIDADKGVLKLFVNDVLIDSFNLRSAFIENDRNNTTGQVSGRYGDQQYGAIQTVGQATPDGLRVSDAGHITILNISKFQTFTGWQYGKARVHITPALLQSGYNEVYLTHHIEADERETAVFQLFYDTSNNLPVVSMIDIQEDVLVSSSHLSGIKYYSIGDSFSISYTSENMFDKVYNENIVDVAFPGISTYTIDVTDSDLTGVSPVPHVSDIIYYNTTITLDTYDDYNIDALLHIKANSPFTSVDFYSASQNILINTKLSDSTQTAEYFYDELYRLPITTYDTPISQTTGQWDSSQQLGEFDALIFDGKLQFANMNFSDYLPFQAVDYSGRTQNQYYIRSFKDFVPHNNGSIRVGGIDKNDILNDKIRLDIKIPGTTGWLNVNTKYDISSFSGEDGDGCLVNIEGDTVHYSTGQFSTAYSSNTIVLRITMKFNSPAVHFIEFLWGNS